VPGEIKAGHRSDVSVTNIHTVVPGIRRNTLKCGEDMDGQHQVVSTACPLPVSDQLLTVPQTHARSAIPTINEPRV